MFKQLLVIVLLWMTGLMKADKIEGDIQKLRTELFKNRGYDVMTIPVKNFSTTLNVDLEFDLLNILSLDISTHILTTEGWLLMIWHDEHLTWDPRQYGGLDVLRVSPKEVFKPDIILYNSADIGFMRKNMIDTNLLLYSSGLIFWVPPITLKSLCEMDLTNWPFDEQRCFLKFGSWTYDGLAINLTERANISLRDYWPNPEWDVTYTGVERIDKYFECCPEPYPEIKLYLNLKRRTSLYHYTVFLPVTTAMIINLLVFWFEIRSKIRFILSGISLLMLTLILLYLGQRLGFGSVGLPFAICYISKTILTIGFMLVWSTIAYNVIDLNIKLPEVFDRITGPAVHIIYSINDSDSIQLTSDSESNVKVGNYNRSLNVLITIIDKIFFVIFLIIIISLHL